MLENKRKSLFRFIKFKQKYSSLYLMLNRQHQLEKLKAYWLVPNILITVRSDILNDIRNEVLAKCELIISVDRQRTTHNKGKNKTQCKYVVAQGYIFNSTMNQT